MSVPQYLNEQVASVPSFDEDGHLLLWRSAVNPMGKLHLDLNACPVTENMRQVGLDLDEKFERVVVEDLLEVCSLNETRPCRKCALLYVAGKLLDGSSSFKKVPRKRKQPDRVFVTFTSQPSVKEAFSRGRQSRDYRFDASTDTAGERLLSLCEQVGLPTINTSVGPVAYGFAPTSALTFLARNFRLETRWAVTELPEPVVVVTAWELWSMNPPQLESWREGTLSLDMADLVSGSAGSELDIWYLSELVCSTDA